MCFLTLEIGLLFGRFSFGPPFEESDIYFFLDRRSSTFCEPPLQSTEFEKQEKKYALGSFSISQIFKRWLRF